MIPYPCWLPSASAVRIRNVASCIARSVIHTLYTVGLAAARPPELPRRWAGQAAHRERCCLDHDQAVFGPCEFTAPRAVSSGTAASTPRSWTRPVDEGVSPWFRRQPP